MNILELAILKKMVGGGGGSGTDNYNDLSNLPQINGETLAGDKSSSSLGLQSEIKEGSELASDLVDDTNQDNKFVTSAEKLEWSGKQNLIDSSHKLSSDLVDDADKTNKFVTASEKETWNGKQNLIDNSHKLSSDLVDDTNKTNKFVTSTEKNTWNAKQNAIDSDHKLSSSLVSFSEAEAAALASGIDSTKVGQISTNQTNILLVEDMVCATEFSSSTAYAVGDMVTYEHKLYKFINAHQGAWSASDVQNYDLTYLQAEDRASLAEVVDSGAKNLLNISNATFGDRSKVTFNSDGSVTGAITDDTRYWSWANSEFKFTLPAGSYVLYCVATSGTNINWGLSLRKSDNSEVAIINYYTSGNYVEFTLTSATEVGFMGKIFDRRLYAMVCTKAAFGVSQKFVPHRPDWDTMGIAGLRYLASKRIIDSTDEFTYKMNKQDFIVSSPDVDKSMGTYIISIITWSTTPQHSLYMVSYTGGDLKYNVTTKIAGSDRTVTVDNSTHIITVSGFGSYGGKVTIHALL